MRVLTICMWARTVALTAAILLNLTHPSAPAFASVPIVPNHHVNSRFQCHNSKSTVGAAQLSWRVSCRESAPIGGACKFRRPFFAGFKRLPGGYAVQSRGGSSDAEVAMQEEDEDPSYLLPADEEDEVDPAELHVGWDGDGGGEDVEEAGERPLQAKSSAPVREFRSTGSVPASDTRSNLRLVSYNVLGPKQAMSDKHGYSHYRLRKWPFRRALILDELKAYRPDVVCLQEVTPDTFQDDFAPFFKELGLTRGIYTPKRIPRGQEGSQSWVLQQLTKGRRIPRSALGDGFHACLGTATFVRTDRFRVVAQERVLLRSKFPLLASLAEEPEGTTESDAAGQADEDSGVAREAAETDAAPQSKGDRRKARAQERRRSALRHGGRGPARSTPALVPEVSISRHAHAKSPRQAEAAGRSRRSQRRSRGKERGVPGTVSEQFGYDIRSKADTATLTLLEDMANGRRVVVANAHLFWNPKRPDIKLVQAALLCAATKAFADQENAETPEIVVCGDFNSVRQTQVEFLNERARGFMETSGAGAGAGTPSQDSGVWTILSQGRVSSDHPEHPAAFGSSTALPSLGSGLPPLHNVLLACGAAELPPLSTKTATFCGTIDHIWATGGVGVAGLLEMPRFSDDPGTFAPIPNADWGSDHLAIGADLAF